MKKLALIPIFVLLVVSLDFYHDGLTVERNKIQETAVAIKNEHPSNRLLTENKSELSWEKLNDEVENIENSEEIDSRIQSIEALIAAKKLIQKMNVGKADKDDRRLAIELIRERSLLIKRKIEMNLVKVEKEFL